MADPKYAGLPGIALDQPDMFETSGTGDDEAEEEEGSGGEVEEPAPVLHLSSLSWLGDLEIGSGGETEGLVQRYTRLRCEVAELAEELDAMTESAREGQVAGLSLQVSDLGQRLARCEIAEKAGGSVDGGEGAKQVKERLMKDIEGLRKAGGDSKSSATPGLYQLYLDDQQQVKQPGVDLASVEGRLAALERAVGPQPVGERRALSAATDGKSLQYAVDNLAAKRSYFQQQHLDHVEGRLAALSLKMNAIGEQKAAIMTAREEDKLSRLCKLVEGQASLATVLPELVERLEEVEKVGGRAAAWPEILDSCEQSQQNTKKIISDTKTSVEETTTTLEGSLASVADKFSELQKKLQTIKT